MNENVTRPRAVGSIVSTGNGGLDLLNWPLTAVATLSEANVRLALTLADRFRAALERLGQIGEKVLTECDTEGRIVLRRAFEPGRADIGDDVRPGQWEDVIADLEEWRLEVTEGVCCSLGGLAERLGGFRCWGSTSTGTRRSDIDAVAGRSHRAGGNRGRTRLRSGVRASRDSCMICDPAMNPQR